MPLIPLHKFQKIPLLMTWQEAHLSQQQIGDTESSPPITHPSVTVFCQVAQFLWPQLSLGGSHTIYSLSSLVLVMITVSTLSVLCLPQHPLMVLLNLP